MRLLILIDAHTFALHESNLSGEELVQAVHAANACLHLPPSPAGWQAVLLADLVVALPAAGEEHQPLPVLNPRQAEVLDMLLEGLSTKQIATRLNVTTGTVRKYILKVQARLGVSTREEAILKALVPGAFITCGKD